MPTFELICLANSRKYGGRCVAGLRTDGGGWVRPIGPIEEGVLQPRDYRLADGTETRLLDVVRIGCAKPEPKPHHPEDWVIDRRRWQLIARPAAPAHLQMLRRHLVQNGLLLANWGDRVPYDAYTLRPAEASLALVAPEKVEWVILDDQGKRRMRVRFLVRGMRYDLSLTDPVWEQRLNRLPVGTYPRDAAEELRPDDELLLTISLGEPFQAVPRADACCYKLVAAVITLPPRAPDRPTGKPGSRAADNAKMRHDLDLSSYPDPFPNSDADDFDIPGFDIPGLDVSGGKDDK